MMMLEKNNLAIAGVMVFAAGLATTAFIGAHGDELLGGARVLRAPLASTPRFTASIISGKWRWQLLKPLRESAMPTTGCSRTPSWP